jgi:GTP-binding protein LepA
LLVSAKDGSGVADLLEAVVTLIPPPKGNSEDPLKCLIFDSFYDVYRGVIPHIRVFQGTLKHGDKIMLKSTSEVYEVDEVGYFEPRLNPCEKLSAGEVGYVGAIIKKVGAVHVGDTIISPEHPEVPAIEGFRRSQPMVFCGIYPINTNDYPKLTISLEKFQLNDSSITFEKESSAALGHGYRLGFMGMLHMEITLERLKREYGQELIATMPSVIYKVVTTTGQELFIDNPSKFPDPTRMWDRSWSFLIPSEPGS